MANVITHLSKKNIEDLLPDMAKRFTLQGRNPIGEHSGFGTVWKALDTWLNREVAIKISNTDLSDEIMLCRDIEGQTIRIFDYFRGKGNWNAYAMELLEPPWITLSTFIEKHKYQQNDVQHYFDCFEIVYYTLLGLREIHGRPYCRQGRYVHADIKPANLFIFCNPQKSRNTVFRMPEHDQVIKIIDMGISTPRGEINFAGTPAYDYPEKQEARPGHDLYALGIIFLEMLGGELPDHGTMAHKTRINKAVTGNTSGSMFIDGLAIEFTHKCARAATQPIITAEKLIAFLDKVLFGEDAARLIAIRAINKYLGAGLKKNELAGFLFPHLASYYSWKNKSAIRLEMLNEFVADMYTQKMLERDGHSYFVR